jgi:hypothetical protein
MITRGMPFADYLALPGLHMSTLKAAAVSPRHYRHAVEHAKADAHALRLGRLVHQLTLTPELPPDVALYEGPVRRGKKWEEFQFLHADQMIVTASEIEESAAMRLAVRAHGPAAELLSRGEGEVTVQWEVEGQAAKGRLDWLDGSTLIELKTTRAIAPRRFAREVVDRAYHAQLAWYAWGLRACGHAVTEAKILAVENVAPFDVAIYTIGPEELAAGERLVTEWVRTVIECERTGTWPGVDAGAGELALQLPDWALMAGMPEVDLGGIGG